MKVREHVGAVLARLRRLRLAGQLTRDDREQLDAVIQELEMVLSHLETKAVARKQDQVDIVLIAVARIAAWLISKHWMD